MSRCALVIARTFFQTHIYVSFHRRTRWPLTSARQGWSRFGTNIKRRFKFIYFFRFLWTPHLSGRPSRREVTMKRSSPNDPGIAGSWVSMRTTAVSAVAVRCSMQKSRGIQYTERYNTTKWRWWPVPTSYTPHQKRKKKERHQRTSVDFVFIHVGSRDA